MVVLPEPGGPISARAPDRSTGGSQFWMRRASSAYGMRCSCSLGQRRGQLRDDLQRQRALEADPDNARFWYRLGVSQRGAGHFQPALESLEKARTLGAAKGLPGYLVDYEVGTTYAAMGDSGRAIKALKDAAGRGLLQVDRVQNDAEWNPTSQGPAIRRPGQRGEAQRCAL